MKRIANAAERRDPAKIRRTGADALSNQIITAEHGHTERHGADGLLATSSQAWPSSSAHVSSIYEPFPFGGIACGSLSAELSCADTDDVGAIVCYGMLPGINCQILRNGPGIDENNFRSGGERLTQLSLEITASRINIGVLRGTPFAQVNVKDCAALQEIARTSRTSFAAYAFRASLQKLSDSGKKPHPKAATYFPLYVNLLGPEDEAEMIGVMLSDCGLHLQVPFSLPEGLRYTNPHVWTFPEISEQEVWLAGLALENLYDGHRATGQDWSQVLDDLPEVSVNALPIDDAHINLELLPHQKEALNFMTARETGQLNDTLRYWKADADEHGQPTFRHSITCEERQERPREPLGGVLADDMGLGKTLTAISLITTSIGRSQLFARTRAVEQVIHGSLTATKSTLIVVPSLLILQEWEKEIERRTVPGYLNVIKYHGHNRVPRARDLCQYDIVLTTYGTVSNEHRKTHRRDREVLYFLRWFRIILDEAHTIRSSGTAQCKAVLALNAEHHWCLTGTPISNKVEDVAPLLCFCRVPSLYDPANFRNHVTNVTRKSFRQGCNALRQALSPICLRRTRDVLKLPEPRSTVNVVEFSVEEKDAYRKLFSHTRQRLDAAISHQDDLQPRHTILQVLLQLRIFCNQGTYMPPVDCLDLEMHLDQDEALTLLQEEDRAGCASCAVEVLVVNQQKDLHCGALANCSHLLCAICYANAAGHLDGGEALRCPSCTQPFSLHTPHSHQNHMASAPPVAKPHSSKLERLVQDLRSSNNREKSIVFSAWKKTLDTASVLCLQAGIAHVRIDGTVPQESRQQALERFTSDPNISTLLMTLGTGALGLNLTAATRIHILEPQWNPAVENQAIGRAIRLGQERSATIIRYTVSSSVEQQIQSYQKRKLQLAAGGFGDSATQLDLGAKISAATFWEEEQ